MQVSTSLQTDNHASTPPLSFLQAGCPSCHPTNSVKALKANAHLWTIFTNLDGANNEDMTYGQDWVIIGGHGSRGGDIMRVSLRTGCWSAWRWQQNRWWQRNVGCYCSTVALCTTADWPAQQQHAATYTCCPLWLALSISTAGMPCPAMIIMYASHKCPFL